MCSFFSLFVNILFEKLEVNCCLCYVMFLDTQSNLLKCLQIFYNALHLPYLISIFFEIKKKKQIQFFYLKLFIYLFITHMLDTTKKESTSEDHMPSQKFKYCRKRLLARAYGPRRPSYLHLSLKEILRPYLRK